MLVTKVIPPNLHLLQLPPYHRVVNPSPLRILLRVMWGLLGIRNNGIKAFIFGVKYELRT
jgi:hypothetical protein